MEILGIDIGGSGIKGALVDVETGTLKTDRFRVETPRPANQEAFVWAIQQIKSHFEYQGPIGIGFPGVVQNGIIRTAANVDKSWIDVDAASMFKKKLGSDCFILNDADAAGVAEVKFGTTVSDQSVVIFLTVGTGIGSAVFTDKQLLPNTEFGHVLIKDDLEAEHYASDAVRKREDLNWGRWGKRFNRYLKYMDSLFWPDLFVIGGGVSKKMDKFEEKLTITKKVPVVPASLLNEAGIIGAAYFAHEQSNK